MFSTLIMVHAVLLDESLIDFETETVKAREEFRI
jgi:hypothetical protein